MPGKFDWDNCFAKIFDEDIAKVAVFNDEWRKTWLNHCVSCGGRGGHFFVKVVDASVPEHMFHLFDAIKDPHICHRCGAFGLNEDSEGP